MKSLFRILITTIALILPAILFAAGFQVYPGAKLEDVYESGQPGPGTKMTQGPKVVVFTTSDSFESVVIFYRGLGREYRVPGGGKPMKLPSGREFKEAYFVFDSAADIMTSKHWIKIQRPYLGSGQIRGGTYAKQTDVREVTAIIEEDRRTYP